MLRAGVDVGVADLRRRARVAEDLEHDVFGVERDDLVGGAGGGRGVDVGAENPVQSVHGEYDDPDHRGGHEQHPAPRKEPTDGIAFHHAEQYVTVPLGAGLQHAHKPGPRALQTTGPR